MKRILVFGLVLALVATVVVVETASARTLIKNGPFKGSYSAIGGSTNATISVQKSIRDAPVSTKYSMPDVYYVGQDTVLNLMFRYNTKQKGNFGTRKKPKWLQYGKTYGKKSFVLRKLSVRRNQTTGTPEGDAPALNPNVSLYWRSEKTPKATFRPNKSKRVPVVVRFDNCFSWPEIKDQAGSEYLQEVTGVSAPPPGYPCVFGQSIIIEWEANITGKKKGKRYSTTAFGSFQLVYIPLLLPVP